MSSTADVIAMSHFGKTVESKFAVFFPCNAEWSFFVRDTLRGLVVHVGSNRKEINVYMINYANELAICSKRSCDIVVLKSWTRDQNVIFKIMNYLLLNTNFANVEKMM